MALIISACAHGYAHLLNEVDVRHAEEVGNAKGMGARPNLEPSLSLCAAPISTAQEVPCASLPHGLAQKESSENEEVLGDGKHPVSTHHTAP